MKANRCTSLTKDGLACSATPRVGTGYCPWHDPSLEAERHGWKINAGKSKSTRNRARKKILSAALDLHEIDGALCQALLDVLDGTLEPNIGSAAATIARTVSTIRAASELETRLTALEAQIGTGTGVRRFP
jgi:hypothetical protein